MPDNTFVTVYFDLYRHDIAVDPSRIASSIITGIGFLGAGAILKEHERDAVRGLTTAACMWVVAAIGMAVGCGFYSAALITTLFTLIVLFFYATLRNGFLWNRNARTQEVIDYGV